MKDTNVPVEEKKLVFFTRLYSYYRIFRYSVRVFIRALRYPSYTVSFIKKKNKPLNIVAEAFNLGEEYNVALTKALNDANFEVRRVIRK